MTWWLGPGPGSTTAASAGGPGSVTGTPSRGKTVTRCQVWSTTAQRIIYFNIRTEDIPYSHMVRQTPDRKKAR